MALTYNWLIKRFSTQNTDNANNVVVEVHWVKAGTNANEVIGECHSSTTFNSENINSDAFIQFNDLTEETVINWIESSFDAEKAAWVEEQIQMEINQIENPPLPIEHNVGLPWQSE